MKRITIVFMMLVFSLFLIACSSSDNTSEDTNNTEGNDSIETSGSDEGLNLPDSWVAATTATGSSSHAQTLAWTNKISQDTGMKVRVVPENSGPVKLKGIESGQFDSHYAQLGEIVFAIQAQYGYESKDVGPMKIAGLWSDSAQPSGVMVRGDSDIETVNDIKPGTRIAYWAIPGGLPPIEALLNWAGVSIDDVILVETSDYSDQISMVADGRADLATMVTPTAPAATEAAATPQGIKFLDLNPEKDPEGAKRFNEVMPTHTFLEINYGVEEAIGNYGWGTSGWYWVKQDKDPDEVYSIVKWIDENYDDIKTLHQEFDPNISVEAVRKAIDITYMPLHEGTIKYLKEIGEWTEEDDLRQEYNSKLVDKYVEAFEEAVQEAESQNINVDATNEEWVSFWEKYKEDKNIPRLGMMTNEEIKQNLEVGF